MNMRKTKVICTLGPAVDSDEMLRKLIIAGMNCARFNFSHGTHESHLVTYNRLRRVRDELGRPVAALLDTKGPEIPSKTAPPPSWRGASSSSPPGTWRALPMRCR